MYDLREGLKIPVIQSKNPVMLRLGYSVQEQKDIVHPEIRYFLRGIDQRVVLRG
jgi:hypothetical protein